MHISGRFLIFATFAFLSGCAGETQRAVDYNNAIIAVQSDITVSLNRLDSAVYSDDPVRMNAELDNYVNALARAETNISELGPFPSDTAFYQATVGLIDRFKELGKGYDSVIHILQLPAAAMDTSMQNRAFAYKREIFTGYADAHRSFLAAQLEFAVKNKFVLKQQESEVRQ